MLYRDFYERIGGNPEDSRCRDKPEDIGVWIPLLGTDTRLFHL